MPGDLFTVGLTRKGTVIDCPASDEQILSHPAVVAALEEARLAERERIAGELRRVEVHVMGSACRRVVLEEDVLALADAIERGE